MGTFVLFLFYVLPDLTGALPLLLVDLCNNATGTRSGTIGWGDLSLSSGGDVICKGHRCVVCDRSICRHCICCC